jgi:hypothetical protein
MQTKRGTQVCVDKAGLKTCQEPRKICAPPQLVRGQGRDHSLLAGN